MTHRSEAPASSKSPEGQHTHPSPERNAVSHTDTLESKGQSWAQLEGENASRDDGGQLKAVDRSLSELLHSFQLHGSSPDYVHQALSLLDSYHQQLTQMLGPEPAADNAAASSSRQAPPAAVATAAAASTTYHDQRHQMMLRGANSVVDLPAHQHLMTSIAGSGHKSRHSSSPQNAWRVVAGRSVQSDGGVVMAVVTAEESSVPSIMAVKPAGNWRKLFDNKHLETGASSSSSIEQALPCTAAASSSTSSSAPGRLHAISTSGRNGRNGNGSPLGSSTRSLSGSCPLLPVSSFTQSAAAISRVAVGKSPDGPSSSSCRAASTFMVNKEPSMAAAHPQAGRPPILRPASNSSSCDNDSKKPVVLCMKMSAAAAAKPRLLSQITGCQTNQNGRELSACDYYASRSDSTPALHRSSNYSKPLIMVDCSPAESSSSSSSKLLTSDDDTSRDEQVLIAPWKDKKDWSLLFSKEPAVMAAPTSSSRLPSSETTGRTSISAVVEPTSAGFTTTTRALSLRLVAPAISIPLHEKLLSPGRRKSPQETKQASDERHARAGRFREALAEVKQARLARHTKPKGEAVKSMMEERVEQIQQKFEEKIARSAELRQQHLASIVQKAGEEGRKVAEVAFINQLTDEDKKIVLQMKLEEGEARRRERQEEAQAKFKMVATAAEEAAERRREAEEKRQEELATKLEAKERRQAQAQARLDEERRAAAALKGAARDRQLKLLDAVAEERRRQQQVLVERIEERLKEASQRRQQQLELIRERAALGTGGGSTLTTTAASAAAATAAELAGAGRLHSPTSGRHQPISRDPHQLSSALLIMRTAPSSSSGLVSHQPPPSTVRVAASATASSTNSTCREPLTELGSSSVSGSASSTIRKLQNKPLSVSASPFIPASTPDSATYAPAAPHLVAAAPAAPAPAPTAITRSMDGSITMPTTARNRLKGMRKRMAKLTSMLEQRRFFLKEAETTETLKAHRSTSATAAGDGEQGDVSLQQVAESAGAPYPSDNTVLMNKCGQHVPSPEAMSSQPFPRKQDQKRVIESDRMAHHTVAVKPSLSSPSADYASVAPHGHGQLQRGSSVLTAKDGVPCSHTTSSSSMLFSVESAWKALLTAAVVLPSASSTSQRNAGHGPADILATNAAAASDSSGGARNDCGNTNSRHNGGKSNEVVVGKSKSARSTACTASTGARADRSLDTPHLVSPAPAVAAAAGNHLSSGLRCIMNLTAVAELACKVKEDIVSMMQVDYDDKSCSALPFGVKGPESDEAVSCSLMVAEASSCAVSSGIVDILCEASCFHDIEDHSNGGGMIADLSASAAILSSIISSSSSSSTAYRQPSSLVGMAAQDSAQMVTSLIHDDQEEGFSMRRGSLACCTSSLECLYELMSANIECTLHVVNSGYVLPLLRSAVKALDACNSQTPPSTPRPHSAVKALDACNSQTPPSTPRPHSAVKALDACYSQTPPSTPRPHSARHATAAVPMPTSRSSSADCDNAKHIVFIGMAEETRVADESTDQIAYLAVLLRVLVLLLDHSERISGSLHIQIAPSALPAAALAPPSSAVDDLRPLLVGLVLASGIVGRVAELLSLMDMPMKTELTRPIPEHVMQGLSLLEMLTRRPSSDSSCLKLMPDRRWQPAAPNAAAIALVFQESSLVGLPSMLTAVLLQAAPSCVPAEASPARLPCNFVQAASLVMRSLNGLARLDLITLQTCLSSSNHRVEFLHLIGFIVSYCTEQWRATICDNSNRQTFMTACTAGFIPVTSSSSAAVAIGTCQGPGGHIGSATSAGNKQDDVHDLLNEVLMLVGYFAVLAPSNQMMLSWGRIPSVIQRLTTLPVEYFQHPSLHQVVLPTLLAVSYGNEHVFDILSERLSWKWLSHAIISLPSCRPGHTDTVREAVTPESLLSMDSCESASGLPVLPGFHLRDSRQFATAPAATTVTTAVPAVLREQPAEDTPGFAVHPNPYQTNSSYLALQCRFPLALMSAVKAFYTKSFTSYECPHNRVKS
ncbi:hypothetical protein CEUSTIGMA_g1856.t1 [Chlamydomonas eustigma]|uniref:S phase cyclin A-associated protein in the endoplasmic reticulum N-terminal domain-containing protein n=1 Tax=Chlamydomonas eustigma TaxID=1157962 RepID=A0A250WUB4_9CHLO|nr:hypothetical protein CEUSTIGMA_g1856.t1 [Chlamydomonas eustigma]|eukprot:GAX74408.1 hypothetical protein CEUSTIGMA_g1856.t1 [Chlamydomonas eustigma]